MTDQHFLAAVLANPDDDTPRLIYADWLDEQRQGERAEFIRVQVAIAAEESYPGDRWCAEAGGKLRVGVADCHKCRPCLLRRREGELLKGPLGWDQSAVWGKVTWAFKGLWHFRRGFVETVEITADCWLAHADAILAAQPVQHVTLMTMPNPRSLGARNTQWARGVGKQVMRLLSRRWPRVKTFTLPPQMDWLRVQMVPPDTPPLSGTPVRT